MIIVKNMAISKEKIDDEYFLYNEENKKLVCLNKTATIIWDLIDCSEKDALENRFLSNFDFISENEKNSARDDFGKVLTELDKSGCIKYQFV